MAFFDKLNQVAKNLGDKTSDAIETTKLNTKIHQERSAAEAELKNIGEFYYRVYVNGGSVATEVIEFCQNAKAHYDAIEGAQAEIQQIKADNEAVRVAPVPTPQAAPVCPTCGTEVTAGLRFCGECGTKLG